MSNILEIDGSTLEGGGQILRMSLAFSVLLKKSIRVYNIRSGRSTPGLRPQHCAGLNLVCDLSKGQLVGNEVGSTEIIFTPSSVVGGNYCADPGTAGSVMLLFQVSFPCLLYAREPSTLTLRGGTNADMAPQIDHTLMVFKPMVEKIGAKFSCEIIKRGYYPKGGGEVKIQVQPLVSSLRSIECVDAGTLLSVEGRAFVAGVLPIKMSHDMAEGATHYVKKYYPNLPVNVHRIKEPPHAAFGNGSGIIVVGKTEKNCIIGGASLGKRGVSPEEVGKNAATELIEDIESQACVDRHVQDQLIIFMALAQGKSRIRIGPLTLHTKTAIYVAELMTEAKFSVIQDEVLDCNIIECEGIGLCR